MLSESKFREIYRRHQESGLSVKAFCVNEGIAESTFYYWSKKISKKGSKKQNFIPLVVKSTPTHLSGSIPVDHPSVQGSGSTDAVLLEVVYPNGTILRIKKDLDLVHLRALICLFD
jgi:hypothetical protein